MSRGFTLVEILVVITILLILAGLGVGASQYVMTTSRIQVTEGRLEVLGYRALGELREKGACPSSLTAVAEAVHRPGWLEEGLVVDAWGRPLQYEVRGTSFRIRSAGPDGIWNTADDIEFAR